MTAARTEAVFRAISDPTRRAILDLLRHEERTVSELNAPFSMSQPAISQHLRVLSDAGLVRARREAKNRFYSLNAAPLRDAFEWLEHYQQFWSEKLDALGAYLDERAKQDENGRKKARKGEKK